MTLDPQDFPYSKDEAKAQGLKYYRPNKPCLRGNSFLRKVSDRHCICSACLALKAERDKAYCERTAEKKKEREREYHQANKEKRNAYLRQWRKENKEKCIQRDRKRYAQDRDAMVESAKIYYQQNKSKVNLRRKRKYAVCPKRKAAAFCYRVLHKMLEAKNDSHQELLGYHYHELIDHIESQFEPGMSWSNHGEWHIDHIKPMKLFLDEGETRPSVVNALSNLQPLWAADNLAKGAKYED